MAHSEYRLTIPYSSAEVFAYLADGLNEAVWRHGVRAVSLASGSAGQVGAVYAQTLEGPGGRDMAGDFRITESDPGRRLAFEVIAGPARPTGVFELAPDGDGTAVDFTLDFEPTGLLKLLGGAIQKTMDSEVRQLVNIGPAMAAERAAG